MAVLYVAWEGAWNRSAWSGKFVGVLSVSAAYGRNWRTPRRADGSPSRRGARRRTQTVRELGSQAWWTASAWCYRVFVRTGISLPFSRSDKGEPGPPVRIRKAA